MEFYIVLGVATLLIGVLTLLILLKTKTIAFAMGAAFLYYWTLFGAFSVLQQKFGESQERPFDYLFYKMFPVYLDSDYFWALVLYSIFLLTVLATVLHFVQRPRENKDLLARPIRISHATIILISSTAAVLSYLLIKDQLDLAAEMNTNLHFLNPEMGRFYTLHQVFDRIALIPLSLGLAVFLSGKSAKYAVGRRSGLLLAGYICAFVGVFVLNMLSGSRNNLLFAGVSAMLFYLANTVKPKKLVLAFGCVLVLLMLMFISILRDSYKSKEIANLDWPDKIKYAVSDLFARQAESFAAHFSMYGALHKHVPFTYGSSFLWLATAIVPSTIAQVRPMTIYDYYADAVGAAQGQGFNVHHATGWYLNFGVPGLIAGGCLLGWIWAKLFNMVFQYGGRSHLGRVFAAFAFWSFTGYIPLLVRGGPEGYKSAIVEGLLVPTLIMAIASLRLVRRSNRPVLIPNDAMRGPFSRQPA